MHDQIFKLFHRAAESTQINDYLHAKLHRNAGMNAPQFCVCFAILTSLPFSHQ